MTTMPLTRHLPRALRHLWLDAADARRLLRPEACARLEAAVQASEARHLGELRLCVEAGLPWGALRQGLSARQRALELFSALRVWDTAHNNGVLIYLLLADRRVEIVADRGIHACVGDTAWETICGAMQQEFAAGRFEAGMLTGLAAVSDLLAQHFPAQADSNPNELPDAPVIL